MDRLAEMLPAIHAEGLLPALLAVEELLADQLPHGEGRWRDLDADELIDHLEVHAEEIAQDLESIDDDTGHPTAAHVAARALMVLALALGDTR